MRNPDLSNPARRAFLRTAPVVAVAGLALADTAMLSASAQSPTPSGDATFQVFRAKELDADIKALQASPGNKSLVDWKTCTVVLTTEDAKSAKEFEWHEHRDHIFHILDGSTVYQLGGTPKNGHSTRPGEWLAPESEGAETLTLNKGDILVIPRGTPHKRSTSGSVTFMLISPQGDA